MIYWFVVSGAWAFITIMNIAKGESPPLWVVCLYTITLAVVCFELALKERNK